jgi:uncharacterized protein YuzE
VSVKLEYDLNAGALYVRLSDAEIARTAEAGDNAAVDLDARGDVVGIEVISVGHPWPVSDILATYSIPPQDAAEIRAYFRVIPTAELAPGVCAHETDEIRTHFRVKESPVQREPTISTAPAPALAAS